MFTRSKYYRFRETVAVYIICKIIHTLTCTCTLCACVCVYYAHIHSMFRISVIFLMVSQCIYINLNWIQLTII